VIRTRQYLSALLPRDEALVLNLMRFQQELRDLEEFEFPAQNARGAKVAPKELELAEQLIDGMTGRWEPASFRDEYRDALMKMIEKKVKKGDLEAVEEFEEAGEQAEPATINLMDVLKKSLQQKTDRKRKGRSTARAKKKTTRTRATTRKKKVG
jgi:DNA end-binding protein Ku